MAKQVIDTTTPQPNGKQGEPIRTAFEKSNSNFTELYEGVGEAQSGVNGALKAAQNLADLDDAAEARENLGVDLQKLSTDYYGDTEPTVTWPGMTWADSAAGLLKRRNAANSAWVTLGGLFTEKADKSQVFGIDQSPQDVKASRALGTTYVNSSDKAMFVWVALSNTAGPYAVQATVSGVFMQGGGSPSTTAACMAFIVPAGGTYRVDVDGGGVPGFYSFIEYK